MMQGKLRDELKDFEGLSLSLYKEPISDQWHIGYGRNIEVKGISNVEADILLDTDIAAAIRESRDLPVNFFMLAPDARVALAHMCFQMGQGGVLKFRRMLARLNQRPVDYEGAAAEILDSLLAKQTPERAAFLAAKMRAAGGDGGD